MTVYEFSAISSVMCVETDDPKIATACALWWAPNVPAVCEDESVSPLHLFGFLNDDSLTRMDEYFDGSICDFFEERKSDIETCINTSLYPFGKETLQEMQARLESVTEEEKAEFITSFLEKNASY